MTEKKCERVTHDTTNRLSRDFGIKAGNAAEKAMRNRTLVRAIIDGTTLNASVLEVEVGARPEHTRATIYLQVVVEWPKPRGPKA